MRKVVANTTPLIALTNTGHLNLLRELYGEILIPQAVMDEIKSEPAKSAVEQSDWIKVCSIADDSPKKLFRARLHAGEVEVMILAGEINADLLIIDDNAAKKTAKYLGMNVTGTLGVLLRAKREGRLTAVKPVLVALRADGMFISDEIVSYVLKEAGETV